MSMLHTGKYTVKMVCTCLLVWYACTLQAQLPDYHLQTFGYGDGIKAGNIIAAAKDTKGFLWILTPRSLQRFDGKHTKDFQFGESVHNLLCDAQGHIWIVSGRRIYQYVDDYREFKQVPLSGADSTESLGSVIERPDHTVWLIAHSGFYQYDEQAQQFIPVHRDLSVQGPISERTAAYCNNTFFFRKDSLIYAWNIATKELRSLRSIAARIILPVNDDSVMLGTWENNSYWYNFSKQTISLVRIPAGIIQGDPASVNARSISVIRKGVYLLVAREGLFEYNNTTGIFKKLHFYLQGLPVEASDFADYSFIDNQGYAWLATNEGMAKFSTRKPDIGLVRIKPFNESMSASVNNVRRLVEDKEGSLWMATGNGFVRWKIKQNKWSFYTPVPEAAHRLAYPSIRGLAYDGRYLILGPTNFGLWLFDPVTEQYRRPIYPTGDRGAFIQHISEGDFVDDIVTLQNGNHLVMGRDAIYVLNGKTYLLDTLQIPAAAENSNMAFQASNGTVWIATNIGLHCLDANLHYLGKAPLPKESSFVTSAFMRPDNQLLFTIRGSIFTANYDGNNITVQKVTAALGKSFISTIFQDRNDVIWAATENGIYRYDPRTAKQHLFDYSDNVQGYGFNNNAWLRCKSGLLLLGGTNGINYLYPEALSSPADNIGVFIRHVRVNNDDTLYYGLPKHPTLQYNQQSIDVEFAFPFFNNPDKVQYRYQLAGLDNEWKSIGHNNTVRLTSLPPGDYTLRVQGSLNAVDWVEAPDNFSFKIDAPYWRKWWFVAPLLLLAILAAWLYVRNRNKKLHQKQEELDIEQAINYFASSLYEHQQVDGILWDVAKNCIGRLQFEDCVIYLVDPEKNVLVQKAAHGPKNHRTFSIKEPLMIPVGQGITGSVAASGKGEIINDTSKDPRYIVDDKPRLSEITVPILSGDKVLGVIDCEHSKKGFFTQKHLSILTTIASLCANKIVRAKAEAERKAAELILMDTRQKMADVEMQALRAQMNPHFIFNCLNSINRYIVKSDQATASLYLTKFAKLIRLILDNSNSKHVLLSNELEALKLYIDMEYIRFEKKFTYQITVDKNVQTDNIEVPPLIIQPYVENAIWHGLLHKQSMGQLKIDISMPQDMMLQCVIEDNGIGREKSSELKSKSATTKKSLGMKLTENRLALLNSHAEMHARVDIENLYAPDGEPSGTKVILMIPV